MPIPQNDMNPAERPPAVDQPTHPAAGRTSDHLANERTFLAWIRTSISVIGLGFVVAKFSVWLRELAVRLNDPAPTHRSSLSLPMGIAMMALGALLAVIAAWRYHAVKIAIQRGGSAQAEGAMVAVSIIVACVAAALIVYMLATA